MTNKKIPERFCIRFNLSNPEHLEVVSILSEKGRNVASYIADAILCYEKSKQSNFNFTIADVVNKVFEMSPSQGTHTNTETIPNAFEFSDVAEDLAAFKK